MQTVTQVRSGPAAPSAAIPGRLVLAWLLVAVGLIPPALTAGRLPILAWIFFAAGSLALSCKLAALVRLPPDERRRLTAGRLVAFLLWPGLRPQQFFPDAPPVRDPRRPLALSGIVNLLSGTALLWMVPHLLPASTSMDVRLWLAMIGLMLLTLFGLFDLYALLYRRLGFAVEKLWDNPLRSASLTEMWGRRWNRVFSGFTRDLFYHPLSPVLGARAASFVVFLFACLVHEWAWSLPVQGGYGGPTAYFLIQGVGWQVENTRPGRRLRRRTLVGRLWTGLVVLAPLPLILHGPFREGFAAPLLAALGVPGLTP